MISVEDNGPGFPPSMLESETGSEQDINIVSGRTKLGLVFCRMVAALHRNGGREGYIRLENGGKLGGGRFSVLLP